MTFFEVLVDVVPTPTKVGQMVRARMRMSWFELAQNTLELGDRWPMLLAMVRAAEHEGDAEHAAERARDQLLLRRKRWRVQQKLRSNMVKCDKTVMVVTADGRIPKVYMCKKRALTRALRAAQARA